MTKFILDSKCDEVSGLFATLRTRLMMTDRKCFIASKILGDSGLTSFEAISAQ